MHFANPWNSIINPVRLSLKKQWNNYKICRAIQKQIKIRKSIL